MSLKSCASCTSTGISLQSFLRKSRRSVSRLVARAMEKSVLPKRDWVDMTWEDLSGADKTRWIAVLAVAAIERHGPHVRVGVDAFIGAAYLSRARALLPADLLVSFLPMRATGTSEEHRAFPGTLTLSADTLIRVLT